jgi:hypothetical protein
MTATPTARVFTAVAGHGAAATELATKALYFASQLLDGRLRHNGDPHITHTLEVAATVAGLGADVDTIVAALLHSPPEGKLLPLDQIRAKFGSSIADILTDFSQLHCNSTRLKDVSGIDPRAVILKIADRLHNMQTIQCLEKATQQRKADQTRELVAPIARTLGLVGIATELDVLACAILGDPDAGALAPSIGGLTTRSVLHAAAHALLPGHCQERWLIEWDAELQALTRRRDRLAFTLSLLLGLPSMAILARRSHHVRDGAYR